MALTLTGHAHPIPSLPAVPGGCQACLLGHQAGRALEPGRVEGHCVPPWVQGLPVAHRGPKGWWRCREWCISQRGGNTVWVRAVNTSGSCVSMTVSRKMKAMFLKCYHLMALFLLDMKSRKILHTSPLTFCAVPIRSIYLCHLLCKVCWACVHSTVTAWESSDGGQQAARDIGDERSATADVLAIDEAFSDSLTNTRRL